MFGSMRIVIFGSLFAFATLGKPLPAFSVLALFPCSMAAQRSSPVDGGLQQMSSHLRPGGLN